MLRAEQSAGFRVRLSITCHCDKSLTEATSGSVSLRFTMDCRDFSPPWPGRQDHEAEGVHLVTDSGRQEASTQARTKGAEPSKPASADLLPPARPRLLRVPQPSKLLHRLGRVDGTHARSPVTTGC